MGGDGGKANTELLSRGPWSQGIISFGMGKYRSVHGSLLGFLLSLWISFSLSQSIGGGRALGRRAGGESSRPRVGM